MVEVLVGGDVVCLKSQQHLEPDSKDERKMLMTIESLEGETATCLWFDYKTLHRDFFKVDALIKASI